MIEYYIVVLYLHAVTGQVIGMYIAVGYQVMRTECIFSQQAVLGQNAIM